MTAAAPSVRAACLSDLPALDALLDDLNPTRPRLPEKAARAILGEILASPRCRLLVREAEGTLVATAMLATVSNLMRGGRPYALLENVVTIAAHRRRGHGSAVVAAALAAAWEEGAAQVYLLTARPDPVVHAFYRSCGFAKGLKTAYVARAPG